MKLRHKLLMVSAAALIGISPILGSGQAVLVHAADQPTTKAKTSKKSTKNYTYIYDKDGKRVKVLKKGTIKLNHNAFVYDKNGNRLKTYLGSAKNTKIVKGITLLYKSKVTIKNKDYYDIGSGAFVKAANVGYVDGKKIVKATTASAKLKRNAYIYNSKGTTDKKKFKKNQTVTVDQLIYIGSKLFYRISGQKDQFIKAANVGKITGAKLKAVNEPEDGSPSDNQNDPTVVTLSHNAYVYDGTGTSTDTLIRKDKKVQVDKLQYIGKKLFYRINDSNYPGEDQWIKKNNVGVITGKQLEPANKKPDDDQNVTLVKLGRDANVYNNKGILQSTKTFAKGHTARVTELRYIWVQADNKAELFYKLQSDKNGYLKEDDISTVSGQKLTPVNTPEDAKNQLTTASDTDKKPLQDLLNEDAAVKAGDAYKLAAQAARSTYDAAIENGKQINTAISTLAHVNDAISQINKAKAALNGKKVVVNNVNNLTMTEADQIVQLVANVYGVDKSAVQFSGNNTVLTITNANGFQQTLTISDYATTNK